ncbi:hypothetical protein NFI96_001855 [Prochilodus magdalenae]|nr:hypothetical protein NFI96_001855 [Prochilodus magdalenae]
MMALIPFLQLYSDSLSPLQIFTRYGKCYTFNSGQDGRPLLVTMKGGMGNGLELMLDIQQDEYLPVWGETDETSFEAGIKVQIHTQDEPPFIDQLGFGVAPGFQTFVSCQEQRLEHPHTVPADGAVGVEVEGHQAFWTCDNRPFILMLTTVPPHTGSLGVSTKTKAGLVTEDDPLPF